MQAPDRLTLPHPLLAAIGVVADREGVDVYVVGGFIRDMLLGIQDRDIDVLVIGDGVAFARKVAQHLHIPTVVVHERFGTAMLPLDSGKLEFVGARREQYDHESRNPVVQPGTLEEDLARRDFTVNALAASLNSGRFGDLHDPLRGRADLAAGILRTPLDPEATFSDDPLRIMRALRFASQLGFSIEERTRSALEEMRDRLSIVSQERIT
jgi:poly(A) polymerase